VKVSRQSRTDRQQQIRLQRATQDNHNHGGNKLCAAACPQEWLPCGISLEPIHNAGSQPAMATFLQIVGAVVLGLIGLFVLLILLGYFVLRRKMSQMGESFTGLVEAAEAISQTVPPFRVTLEPANHREWVEKEKAEAICEELDARGCTRIGRFTSVPPTVLLEAWHLPEQSLFVTVYEHPVGGLWIEAGCEYEDDTLFSYSNGPNHRMGNPPWTRCEFRTGTPVGELLDAVIAERPDKPMRPTSAESFPARFEAAWSRDMDWRIEQGGPSEEEIRSSFESGLAQETDSEEAATQALSVASQMDMVQQIRSVWRERINDLREVQLRESYIVASEVSALEWDRIRDRVIFIHDDLTAEDLAEHMEQYLYEGVGPDEDFDYDDDQYEEVRGSLAQQLESGSPRTVFAESVARQATSKRHENLGATTDPVEADVWLAPQFD